eukprot:gene7564-10305_t
MGSKLSPNNAVTVSTNSDTISTPAINLEDRKRAALFGLFVADATAMPVHWMYNLAQLQRDYGTIRGYVRPKDNFDGSIMNLSNTGGGGRGSDQGDIVGSIILHGKKKYWKRGGNYHYHLGLQAGENTLEAQLVRVLMKSLSDQKSFSTDDFLEKYSTFMQTPDSHHDTYASTCHRMFFANVVRGKPLRDCADNDGHNTDAIDALTLTIPVILMYSEASREVRNEKVREVIAATRKSRVLAAYGEQFADLLVAVLHGADLRQAVESIGSKLVLDDDDGIVRSIKRVVESSRSDPMVACYIDSSFPALLFFAYKYADSTEAAILASANAGGENVARGSLLGALLGASRGMESFPAWSYDLYEKEVITNEIEQFLATSNDKTN